MKTRVLLYSHDSLGLGHFRRITTICKSLVRGSSSVSALCVTGSPRPDLFELPPQTDYVKLPSIAKNQSGQYVSRSMNEPLSKVVGLRGQILKQTARHFRPDIVLVDHCAVGVGHELLPMLEDQRSRGGAVRVILGMRDILDSPQRAKEQMARPAVRRALQQLYDEILVYGHQHVCDVNIEYNLPPTVRQKTKYVGVVCSLDRRPRPTPATGHSVNHQSPRILVTAGGGEDGMPLFECVLRFLQRKHETVNLDTTIVTGPLLRRASVVQLRQRAKEVPRVEVRTSTSKFHRLLCSADLVISMGGYNSVFESLALRKRVLVFPRSHPRREQLDRTRRLSRLGLIDVLPPEVLADPEQLGSYIRHTLTRTMIDPDERGLRFDGADVTARHLLAGRVSASTSQHPLITNSTSTYAGSHA